VPHLAAAARTSHRGLIRFNRLLGFGAAVRAELRAREHRSEA